MTATLLRIEARKMFHYRAFWWTHGIYLILMGFAFFYSGFVHDGHKNGDHTFFFLQDPVNFKFPEIWKLFTMVGEGFLLFPAILIMLMVCNEYQYRTLRQNVIDGLSRTRFLFSKLSGLVIVCLIPALFVVTMAFTLVLSYSGKIDSGVVFTNMIAVPVFFLKAIFYSSFAFMIANIIRRTGFSILVFLIYLLIVENILVSSTNISFHKFLPFFASDHVLSKPLSEGTALTLSMPYFLLTLGYLLAFLLVSFFVVKKRDV